MGVASFAAMKLKTGLSVQQRMNIITVPAPAKWKQNGASHDDLMRQADALSAKVEEGAQKRYRTIRKQILEELGSTEIPG